MDIKRLTDEVLGDYVGLVNTYDRLHSQPELSFAEHRTAEQIVATLRSQAIECKSIAGTGVLAKIEGTKPTEQSVGTKRRAIVLRADIDALPIAEQSASPHPSEREGVMHACGHDLHTTILLGTLAVLNRHREEFDCTIFGLFQPVAAPPYDGLAAAVVPMDPAEQAAALVTVHDVGEAMAGRISTRPTRSVLLTFLPPGDLLLEGFDLLDTLDDVFPVQMTQFDLGNVLRLNFVNGEEIFYISNPALGLWALKSAFTE